jgi:hypothetical protein
VTSVNNWYDVTDYGATGNRTTDDAPAIGSAVTACINGGGGTVYFPGGTNGHYLINEPIVVSTTVPVSFLGDNAKGTWNDVPGASAICCGFAPTAATGGFYAVAATAPSGTTAPAFNMSNMLVLADASNTFGTTVDYAGVYTNTLWYSTLTNVSVGTGLGATGFNSGVHMKSMFGGLLENCNAIAGDQQGFWMDSSAGIELSDSGFSSVAGNGYGNIRMDNTSGTLRIRNCVSIQGDRGLYVPPGAGANPFIFIYDYEINNPRVEGIGLYAGSQLWADQLWFTQSGETSSVLRNNITFGTAYTGYVNIVNSALGSSTGHNIQILGGSGYSFTGCSFGSASFYSSGNYDCINVGANASNVSVANCHFGVDPYSGVGDSRSGVYTNGGAGTVNLSGNMFSPTGWGTAPVIDYANSIVAHGNSGWKHEVQTTTNLYTASTTSYSSLTPSYSINPYEATIGDTYRLVAWGDGTMASGTAVNLDIEGQLGGNAVGYSILSGSVIGAGNGFHWKCTIDLVITGNGVASPGLNFTWGESVTSTTSNQNMSTASNPSGIDFDADTGTSCYLQAQWSSASGSPDIICRGSYLQVITL